MSDLNPDLTPSGPTEPTTEDELEAYFAAAAPEGETETPEPEVLEERPGDGDTPPDTPPDRVSVLGRDLQQVEAQSLLDFYDWVRSNPQQAMAIDAYMRGQAQFVVPDPTPPQPTAPPTSDVDEGEWDELPKPVRDKLAEIDQLKQQVGFQEQDRQMQRQALAQAAVQRGAANFAERYSLNEEELEELQRDTAALGILPGIAAQRGDMLAAVEEALDIAYWRNEKFRSRQMDAYQKQQNETQRRQRKASSVSGGSGSSPRVPDNIDTSTPEGRKAAMVAMISQAQNGN